LTEELNILRKKNVYPYLDLGCGFGRHSEPMIKKSYLCVGLDASFTAAHNTYLRCNTNIDSIQGVMKELPFKNESFGTILAWRSLYLQNVENIKHTLSEIKRVLRIGGCFIGCVRSTSNTLYHIAAQKGKMFEPNTFYLHGDEFPGVIYHFFSKYEMIDILKGFKIEAMCCKALEHTSFTIKYPNYSNDFWVFITIKL